MKKMLALVLAAVTVLSVLTGALLLLPVSAAHTDTVPENNIASDEPIVCPAYDTVTAPTTHSPRAFSEGYPVGIRMGFGAPFTKFSICMPTWGTTCKNVTMSVYAWDFNFDKTRSAEPMATHFYETVNDNALVTMEFDELPAGEYLICIDSFEGSLGVWQVEASVGNGFTYEGTAEKAADWEIKVWFSKTPVQPFYAIESFETAISGDHTSPDEYVTPDDALVNTHKVMPDTWVFTDGLGRESLTFEDVGPVREDKTVAMFYWDWLLDTSENLEPFNNNEFMKENPEAKNDYYHSGWTPNTINFWNEPIYGYYLTDDQWVIRRQAELLANAGVDTILTDNTNGSYTWKRGYDALYAAFDKALTEGAVDVPKISFMLPFGPTEGTVDQLKSIYLDIYREGKYQHLWYYLDGKPMMMGYNNSFKAEASTSNLMKEIYNFFTWRAGQASYVYEAKSMDLWGWLSIYPQATYYGDRAHAQKRQIEQMTVGVAVNYDYVKQTGTAMNGEHVMGRSYTSTYQDRYEKEGAEASKWGYFFSEQFDYALEKDPDVIFVTGWNEWQAARQPLWGGVKNAFADQFTDEYSRDIEPTKGELKDHYYYQLVNYVRKYKGVNPIPTPSTAQTIDLAAGNDQWSTAAPYYAAYIGNTADRDADGYGSNHYTETSGRNDIIGARVARDDNTVWFYVECAADITPYTDALWMNLLIDSDQENKGWETFDYVVGKTPGSADTLVLEKFTDGYTSEKVADVKYKVDGKTMVIEIPKSALGLSGDDYTVNFSWTDNVHDEGDYSTFSGDIMDFYISGDVAPGARFKFSYISTAENSGKEVATDAPTDAPTAAPTDEPTEAPTDAPATAVPTELPTEAPAEDGCKSAVGIGTLALALVTGMTAVALRKKKED